MARFKQVVFVFVACRCRVVSRSLSRLASCQKISWQVVVVFMFCLCSVLRCSGRCLLAYLLHSLLKSCEVLTTKKPVREWESRSVLYSPLSHLAFGGISRWVGVGICPAVRRCVVVVDLSDLPARGGGGGVAAAQALKSPDGVRTKPQNVRQQQTRQPNEWKRRRILLCVSLSCVVLYVCCALFGNVCVRVRVWLAGCITLHSLQQCLCGGLCPCCAALRVLYHPPFDVLANALVPPCTFFYCVTYNRTVPECLYHNNELRTA